MNGNGDRKSQHHQAGVLEQTLNSLTDGVVVVGRNGEFLFVNDQAEKIVGLGARAMAPAAWTEPYGCFLPDQRTPYPADQLPLARAMRGEEAVDEVIFIRNPYKPAGVWITASSNPLINANKMNWGAAVVFRDITERMQAEECLRSTSSRFSALVENHQAGILVESEERRVILLNQAFCDLFNLSAPPNELLGADCDLAAQQAAKLFVDPAEFMHRLEQIMREKHVVMNEELRLSDGRLFERDYIPVCADQEHHGHMWQYRDITESRRSQQRIKVYERLRTALEQTADSVLITNRQGYIEYVNPAFEATTGYRKGEVLGQSPRILKSGRHDKQFYGELWREIMAGRSFQGTILNKKKCGELYWARQTITPMKDEQGKITHFVSVLKDITELLKQQEQQAEMRLARRVQQRFYKTETVLPGFDIAGASHPTHETGGDYYDFIPLVDGCLGIAIGDVSRHGISSALVMAETRAYLRAFAADCSNVGEILTRVNRALSPDLERGNFVTLLFVCLNPHTRSVVYASAGHLPGYLLNGRGLTDFIMESTGPPLGPLADYQYPTGKSKKLDSGQTMLLMTDGITDSLAPEDFDLGVARATEFVQARQQIPAQQIVQDLCQTAHDGVTDKKMRDDATAIILRVL